jgi:hypothetical protein
MADTIEVDLAAVKAVLNDGLSSRPYCLEGCLPKIGLSAEDFAALLQSITVESTASSDHSSLVPHPLQLNETGILSVVIAFAPRLVGTV